MTMNNREATAQDPGLIVAIDKPAEWTSFDVVNKIRRITGVKKVGHAGTLDPFATGVLIVCVGRSATRQVDDLMGGEKEYVADIRLGSETDTMDLTGETTLEMPVPALTREAVEAVLPQFVGEIEQEIPAFSAAKIGGQRSYKLARAGKAVPHRTKWVRVDQLTLEDLNDTCLTVRVSCGKGTYIRTLGRDIARALGSAGHLSRLVRTRVGEYTLEKALNLEAFQHNWQERTALPK